MPHKPRGPLGLSDIQISYLGGLKRGPNGGGGGGALAVLVLILIVIGLIKAGADSASDAIDDYRFRGMTLVRENIRPLGWGHLRTFDMPERYRQRFSLKYHELEGAGTKAIECYYQDAKRTTLYVFWYGTTPKGIEPYTRWMPEDNPFRLLGSGALTKCPATAGEAWDAARTFQGRLPPPVSLSEY